jgi:kinesin family protein 6/9
MGDTSNYEHRGIAPRSIGQLFSEINSRIEFEFKIYCTYMEIYNERIYDLLGDLSSPDQANEYTVAEQKNGKGVFVRGLTEVEVTSEAEALNLLFGGELQKTTAQHKLNRKSNRSHCLFTVYLQQRQRSGVSERIVHSKLHLIDLAGSERIKKTMDNIDGKMGDETTRNESMKINQSLAYLEQCVVALARKGQSHIPYRQSKLTSILKDCLGANCNTLMISCIWGESSHIEETISTLRLSSRMMHVENQTTAVETVDAAALIKKQERIINALKQELLMHDALVDRTGVGYEPYTPEQQASVVQMLEKYVDASEVEEESVLSVDSYRQMLEMCKQFKIMVLNARAEASAAREEALIGGGRGMTADGRPMTVGGGAADALASKIVEDFDPNAITVGDLDASGKSGFVLGAAPADSRPVGGMADITRYAQGSPSPATMSPMGQSSAAHGFGASDSTDKLKASGVAADGRSTAGKVDFSAEAIGALSKSNSINTGDFEMDAAGSLRGSPFEAFVANSAEGAKFYQEFNMTKANLKEIKQKQKDIRVIVNEYKAEIDRLEVAVEERKRSRINMLRKSGIKSSNAEDVVDEEEFVLMKQLREAKKAYKNGFEQLQKLKAATAQAQSAAEASKGNFASAFERWSKSNRAAASHSAGGPPGADYGSEASLDQLDDQEAFDRMEEERVMASDPDSLAFFHAQKTRRALLTQHTGSIKMAQKNKRVR